MRIPTCPACLEPLAQHPGPGGDLLTCPVCAEFWFAEDVKELAAPAPAPAQEQG